MKTRALVLINLITFALLGTYTSCGQVSFQSQLAIKNTPPPDTPVDVQKVCENSVHRSKVVDVHFPKPNLTCEWNKNGNLEPRNTYFQARIEQTADLDIPAGATICNMDFAFPMQEYLYDDHFLMALNGKILASSYDFSYVLSDSNGLLNYDWSQIAGMFWDADQREGVFCPTVMGSDRMPHESTCSWPDTEQAGVISMEFPVEVMYATMANDLNRTHHELKFVSIGDNDDLDCEHSDIRFSVSIDYVE